MEEAWGEAVGETVWRGGRAPQSCRTSPPSRWELELLISTFGHLQRKGGDDAHPHLEGRCPTGQRGAASGVRRKRGGSSHTFPFRAATFGNVTVALAPDRGRSADRRADYHDPTLPPAPRAASPSACGCSKTLGVHAARPCRRARHAGMAARQDRGAQRKLLSRNRHRAPAGRLSLHRQQSRRGGTGQAPYRRRHARPSAAAAGRRRARRAPAEARAPGRRIRAGRRSRPPPPRQVGQTDRKGAAKTGLAGEADIQAATDDPDRRCAASMPGFATSRISRSRMGCTYLAATRPPRPTRCASRAPRPSARRCWRRDGRHIIAGPSGAPARGRTDVLPTGRNLFTVDPRTVPTRPPSEPRGGSGAEELMRRYTQDHGDCPRRWSSTFGARPPCGPGARISPWRCL